MLTILLDENIAGFAEYLSGLLFSSAWSEFSSFLDLRIATLEQIGLAKGTADDQVWELCQQHQFYLLTDNRNEDKPDSLGTMIRTRNLPTSLPVFTISDLDRFRSDRQYVDSVVAKLLEYLLDAEQLLGAGRLYVP